MEFFRDGLIKLSRLWLVWVVVMAVTGTYLQYNPQVYEEAGSAAASAAVETLRSDPEAREWLDAAEAHDSDRRPRGTVAQQWERDRREAELEEAIRAEMRY